MGFPHSKRLLLANLSLSICIGIQAYGTQISELLTDPKSHVATVGTPDSLLVAVTDDNPDKPQIISELESIRAIYKQEAIMPRINGVWQIHGDGVDHGFPGYRFYTVRWDEAAIDPILRPTALALSLWRTFVVWDGGHVFRLGGIGWEETFGSFLAVSRTRIQSKEDAIQVWNASCEIYRRPKAVEAQKISPTEWILDAAPFENHEVTIRFHYQVTTDVDGFCLNGKSIRETVYKPGIK